MDLFEFCIEKCVMDRHRHIVGFSTVLLQLNMLIPYTNIFLIIIRYT